LQQIILKMANFEENEICFTRLLDTYDFVTLKVRQNSNTTICYRKVVHLCIRVPLQQCAIFYEEIYKRLPRRKLRQIIKSYF